MFTRRIDAALDALAVCHDRLPVLREAFQPNTRERNALDDLTTALGRAREALAMGAASENAVARDANRCATLTLSLSKGT